MSAKVTYLDHVLNPTVGVLLNDRFNPDQRLHLRYKQHILPTIKLILTRLYGASLNNT